MIFFNLIGSLLRHLSEISWFSDHIRSLLGDPRGKLWRSWALKLITLNIWIVDNWFIRWLRLGSLFHHSLKSSRRGMMFFFQVLEWIEVSKEGQLSRPFAGDVWWFNTNPFIKEDLVCSLTLSSMVLFGLILSSSTSHCSRLFINNMDRIEKYKEFDFSSNPEWISYVPNIDKSISERRLEYLKRRWYKTNIDKVIMRVC